MFKTAKFSTLQSLPAWKLVVLAFLVSCLAVHFLVEDMVFLSNQSSVVTINQNINELTHQDDLALAVSLPQWISARQSLFAFPPVLPLQAQVFFPILQPPKI